MKTIAKPTFTTLLLAGLVSAGAACTTDEAVDDLDLGEAAQEATATTLATRCVNQIGAKRASIGLSTGNVNEWMTNGQGTYTQCATWSASNDTAKGIPHYTAEVLGFWCGSVWSPTGLGGTNECMWTRSSSKTLEQQVDACVAAWWSEPYPSGGHRRAMQDNRYASCGVYVDNTRITVQANFRNP